MKNLLYLLPLLLLASCKVDFSPNAPWSEVPLVYCVLDQDDSLSIARVQRAYLGEGDQTHYATVMDSINYPQGSIKVTLLQWPAERLKQGMLQRASWATQPTREFDMEYALLHDKDDGLFYGPEQPVYICRTLGQLDTSSIYQILVIRTATGDTLCSGETYLIGNCNDMGNMLMKPNSMDHFNFSGANGVRYCNMQWYTLPRARQYQPYVLFQYHEFYRHFEDNRWDTIITPHEVRINVGTIKSNFTSSSLNTRLAQQSFLTAVKDSITAYQQRMSIDPYAYVDDQWADYSLVAESTVDIYLPCCTEELAAYLFAHETPNGINQEPISYTNIQGGLGIVAARRTHLRFTVPANMANTGGYMKGLKDLNVGF